MCKKICLFGILLLFFSNSLSLARMSYYAGGGMATPILPKEFREIVKTGSNLYFGVGVRYYKLNEVTLGVSVDKLMSNPENEDYLGGTIDITTLFLDFRIRGLRDYQRWFRKYLLASIGYSIFDYTAPGYRSFSRLSLGAGLGIEIKIFKHIFSWLEIRSDITTSMKKKSDSDESMARARLVFHGGIRYNLGNW